jgi:hypothetical protein
MLKEWGWRIVRRSDTKNLSIAEIHVSESGLANAHRVCEYGLENRLQLPGRRRDDLQHLGGRGLLLQRLAESARVRACTSSNSRTFSIAITAWSAKVVTSSICLSVNGFTALRCKMMTPIGVP